MDARSVLHGAPRRVAITLMALLAAVVASPEPGAPAIDAPRAVAPLLSPSTTVTTTAAATTAVATTAPPQCVAVRADEGARSALPEPLASTLARWPDDPRLHDVQVSASVWMEGHGEILAVDADTHLFPASNQKLLTAFGALSLLPHDGTFETTVRANGVVADATLAGDLVLVGGGDPTLTRTGAHSLDALARAVRDAGVRHVRGRVLADESRHEPARAAEGWQDWHIPTYVGPMSALVVDDNRHRRDERYLAQPAVGNAEAFADALARHGVTVDDGVEVGVARDDAAVLASFRSPPFGRLVHDMLLRSDNEIAEMLVREIGARDRGVGSTAAGVAAIEQVIERELCIDLTGISGDGSGLSRADLRSARELRMFVQAARTSPLWPAIDAALPVGAQSGTLGRRFHGTAAAGNVRAKTGSIIGGRALTGHLTTAAGRAVVFSVLVNGGDSPAALPAIDALVVTLAEAQV